MLCKLSLGGVTHALCKQFNQLSGCSKSRGQLSETLDGDTTTYQYNGKNQLTQTSKAGITSTYTYNPNGIRNGKTEGGITTRFIVDENRDYAQVLEEITNGTITTTYSYGHDLISQDKNGATSFYHYDGLGSTRALSDATGTFTDTYDYEAFGEVLNQTGSTENSYLFTGEQFDVELNQYYLRARYYNQQVGRFTQMDTWMGNNHDPITLHKYAYGNADPVTYVDPTGNFGLGSFGVSFSIQGALTAVSIGSSAYDLFMLATGEEELSARQLGTEILMSMLPIKHVKKIYDKACRKQKNSFLAGTLVYTERGLLPIEQVMIGDGVLSFDESEGVYEFKAVVNLIQGEGDYNIYSLELNSGETIEATAEHPFYSSGSWINAENLEVADWLEGLFEPSQISAVGKTANFAKVYNLTVADNHNYLVSEAFVLTHNTDLCDFVTSKVDPKKVVHALSFYKGRTWQVGGSKFRLTKERMKHILERHHPEFFDLRKAKDKNTSLPQDWSLQDIETAILVVINQNRGRLIKAGSGARGGQFDGVYKGVRFRLGIKNGTVGQFTPLD